MKQFRTVFTQIKFNARNHLKNFLVWIFVVVGIIAVCGYNIIASYPTQDTIDDIYVIMQMPLIFMMFGNFNYEQPNTQAKQFISETAIIALVLIVVMNIILTIKLTRQKEDEGVIDLVLTSKASRLSPTISSYILLFIINLIVFTLNLLILNSMKLDSSSFTGHLNFCLTLFIVGFLFQNIAFLISELSSNASNAKSLSFFVFGVLFILRMFIDYKFTNLQIISPLSWIGYANSYVNNSFLPIIIGLILCVLIFISSLYVNKIRDIQAGLIREFKGKENGSRFLNNPYYLRFKLNKGTFTIWIVISAILGLLFGSLVDSVDTFKDNPIFTAILQGDENSITVMMKSLVSMICTMVVSMASFVGLKIFYQIKNEQYLNLTDLFYVSKVKRKDIYLSHLLVGITSTLLIILVSLLFTYLGQGILGNNYLELNIFIESFINYIPLVIFYFTISGILYIINPKLSHLSYVLITLTFVVNTFGMMFFDIPSFVNDILIVGLLSSSPIEEINYVSWFIISFCCSLGIVLSLWRYHKQSLNNLLV